MAEPPLAERRAECAVAAGLGLHPCSGQPESTRGRLDAGVRCNGGQHLAPHRSTRSPPSASKLWTGRCLQFAHASRTRADATLDETFLQQSRGTYPAEIASDRATRQCRPRWSLRRALRRPRGANIGSVFISYRRDDSRHAAGRLSDRLKQRFAADRVFIDVGGIAPGAVFPQAIDDAMASCKVLLAVIGEHWLNAADGGGRRRLNDPSDYVRLEDCYFGDVGIGPVSVDAAVNSMAEAQNARSQGSPGLLPERHQLVCTASPEEANTEDVVQRIIYRANLPYRKEHSAISPDDTRPAPATERLARRPGVRRSGEPPGRPGARPRYVRNHRYTMPHGGTS